MAVETFISSGELTDSRRDFEAKFPLILDEAYHNFRRWQRECAGPAPTRGGVMREIGPEPSPPKSGAYLHRVYHQWTNLGEDYLYDEYRNSGRRGSRFSEDEDDLLYDLIVTRIDEDRASIASVTQGIQAAFKAHNDAIVPGATDAAPFRIPGRTAIRSAIERLTPLEHKIRTRGKAVAQRDMHAVGIGIETTRALERVEIDEHKIDLVVFLKRSKIIEALPKELQGAILTQAKKKRLVISMAIDVHTRCILAVKMSLTADTDLFVETVEMICSPKDKLTDGVAELDWPMYGKPEKIVVDRGPAYVSDRSYELLDDLKIVNMGAAAKKPWLRPFIERMFRTLNDGLIQRFAGRTFGNVVKKGENDAAARAVLNVDEFMHCLLRWIVDIYHTTPHQGLNGLTPYQAWRQAVAVVRPTAVPKSTMRRVFGVKDTRKVDREGITILGNVYASPELYQFFLQSHERNCHTRLWEKDIGVIEVRLPSGEWLTVPARDPSLMGVSIEELHEQRARMAAEFSDEHERIRLRAIYDLDTQSAALKRSAGLAVQRFTTNKLTRIEAQHAVFTRTFASCEARGGAAGLFANKVPEAITVMERASGPPGAAEALSQLAHSPRPARTDSSPAPRPNLDDLMD